MQDPNFLFLLMKNFSRGENADVIENILKKLDKEYNKQLSIIRNLNKKNDELSRENLAQKLKIQELEKTLADRDLADQEREKL